MNILLLQTLFGHEQQWQGPCTVILDAAAAVQTTGSDSVVGGGAKIYAPRATSGRVNADAVCLLDDSSAVLMLIQQKVQLPTGESALKQLLTVADPAWVVAVEFEGSVPLAALGLTAPPVRSKGSHPGTQSRPKPS
jgi:hypothetical protein